MGSHALYAVWLQSGCRTQYVIKPRCLWSSCSAVIDCTRNLGWRVATCTLQRKLAQTNQTHTNLGRSTISPTTIKFSLYLRWDLPRKRTHKGKVLDRAVSLVHRISPWLNCGHQSYAWTVSAPPSLGMLTAASTNTPVLRPVPTQKVWGAFATAQTS